MTNDNHSEQTNQETNTADSVSRRMDTSKPSKKPHALKEIVSTALLLVFAPIAAIIFTAFIFQFYRVDGQSMEQTLQPNDRLIVYKLPKTISAITHNTYMPSRGEIIVFSLNEKSSVGQNESRQLIKRVIGLPGDRVVVHGGKVTIYNDTHPNGYNPDENTPYEQSTQPTSGEADVTVGDGEIFVMGDNRSNSLDSRVFGAIKADEIVGKLVLRVLPFKSFE